MGYFRLGFSGLENWPRRARPPQQVLEIGEKLMWKYERNLQLRIIPLIWIALHNLMTSLLILAESRILLMEHK